MALNHKHLIANSYINHEKFMANTVNKKLEERCQKKRTRVRQ